MNVIMLLLKNIYKPMQYESTQTILGFVYVLS